MDRDRSAIIELLMQLNDLTYRDICNITGKTENTVFKWLNGNLNVPDLAILQLRSALSRARMSVPRELIREANHVMYSACHWARNNKTDNAQAILVGEKLADRTESPFYVYHGQRMQRSQLVRLSKLLYRTVYDRLRGIEPETDVTEIMNRKRWVKT